MKAIRDECQCSAATRVPSSPNGLYCETCGRSIPKMTSREFDTVQSAVEEICELQGTTLHAGTVRRILVNILRTNP